MNLEEIEMLKILHFFEKMLLWLFFTDRIDLLSLFNDSNSFRLFLPKSIILNFKLSSRVETLYSLF